MAKIAPKPIEKVSDWNQSIMKSKKKINVD